MPAAIASQHYLYVQKWNVNTTDEAKLLTFTNIYDGNELEGLAYFPGQLLAYAADRFFALDNDALNLGVTSGRLFVYTLDLAHKPTDLASIPPASSFQADTDCGIPANFNAVSFQIANIEGVPYVALLDGYSMGVQSFPLD